MTGKPKDVKVGNYGVDDRQNQDNRHIMIKDVTHFNNKVTVIIDLTDGVLADIMVYFFGPLSLRSNLPSGITSAYSGRFYSNKFNFLFISLLTLL